MTTAQANTPPLISTDAPKRAVIYTRISDDKTGKAEGVEAQEATGRALAAARGWQVVDVIEENDTSSLKRRPKYDQMIKDAQAGRFEVVIAWAMDRLSRTPQEVEDVIKFAERTGLIIATANGDLDLSTDQGRMVARILASVARAEVERKSVRQRNMNRHRAEKGLPPTTGRAFGYELNGTVIPHEAEIVREVFARYVAGVGASTLHRELNARGITNTRGHKWDRYAMTYLLQNTRYIAERSLLKRDARGVNYREYVGPGNWEPIVDEEIFRAAQQKFADQKARNGGKTAPNKKWIGAGLYRCGLCGDRMFSTYKQSKLADGTYKQRRVYICRETLHMLRTAEPIDDHVFRRMVTYLNENGVKRNDDDRDEKRAREIKVKIRELNARYENAKKAAGAGTISFEMAGAIERDVKGQIAALETEQARLGVRSHSALIAGAADPGAAWLDLCGRDVGAAQGIMREHATITLRPVGSGRRPFDPNSVDIVWHRAEM